ncbi:MAG: PD-(D/E)XK nuclease family protein [Pseudomonadota bacterium]
MEASIAAALAAGRSVIVSSPQRAAALGLAWARTQLAAGKSVWSSPDILTWDAWIRREWQRASADESTAAQLCLSTAQELQVWERVLGDNLRQFAPDLMRAAARAVQEGVRLGSWGSSEEEQLLVDTLRQVRECCQRESLVAVSLLPVDALETVVHSGAPLFVGQQRLTWMQSTLAQRKWPSEQTLAGSGAAHPPGPDGEFIRANSFEAEVVAAADWCQRLLAQDGSRRLLIISALAEPRLPALGNLLWRALSAGTTQELSTSLDPALLAIEGGEPLLAHGLVADALDALQLMQEPIDTAHLGRVLLSPYCGLGTQGGRARLELALRDRGRARWTFNDLRVALSALGDSHPVAMELAAWISRLARHINAPAAPASIWAREFSDSLAQCGFARSGFVQAGLVPVGQLDSADAQRLERWNELLDELASLDCVNAPMRAGAALRQLRLLAARGRHRAASGDAAITLTDDLGDPVVSYDGIWVLGLSENRWPRPPRPNPFVLLAEQRRCNWPEAGVTQRMQQARWAQQTWDARTTRLVLSYPAMEGDVHHRPSSLLPGSGGQWVGAARYPALQIGLARLEVAPEGMPALAIESAPQPQRRLRNGVQLLELQQQCAFRAQAQLRLGAEPALKTSDGIDKRLRGTLLHRTLEALWREIADQQHLLKLSEAQRLEIIDRSWQRAVAASPADRLPADARVMQREALRTRRIILRVLEMETLRAPFQVVEQELKVQATFNTWELGLRIDRVDQLQDGSRLLIDYKSGAPDRMQLDDVNARPIQLAAYVAALHAQGAGADAVALLSLSPNEKDMGFTGRARDATLLPGRIRQQQDWEQLTHSWQQQIHQLVHEHVQGIATVAPLPGACDYCHLDSLCRITDHAPQVDDELDDE